MMSGRGGRGNQLKIVYSRDERENGEKILIHIYLSVHFKTGPLAVIFNKRPHISPLKAKIAFAIMKA